MDVEADTSGPTTEALARPRLAVAFGLFNGTDDDVGW